jgi:hypothetical protein
VWKYLAILVVVLGLAVFIAGQDERAAQESAQKAALKDNGALSTKAGENHPQENVADSERDGPSWYGFFRWPVGTTTWAIILTLMAIADQTKQTAIAAKATQQATEHLIASERAWILVSKVIFSSGASDRPEGNKQVFIQCAAKNHGRTPARVLGLNALYASGPISDPGHTWDDRLYDSQEKTIPRWVILPDKASALHCPIPGFFAERGQVIRADLKEGEAYFIHGVIQYWDMFSETERYTRFCCRWHNDNETPGLDAGFHFAGGDRFNQQT